MEERKPSKIIINGQEYHSLEEVPEEFRALVKEQVDAAMADPRVPPPGNKIVFKKTFNISLKKSIPAPRAEVSRDTVENPTPSIEPSSKGWLFWVIMALGILLYYLYSRR